MRSLLPCKPTAAKQMSKENTLSTLNALAFFEPTKFEYFVDTNSFLEQCFILGIERAV